MIATDYIEDDDGDLLEGADGDFVEDESDGQHIQSLFELDAGELHFSPMTGIGIARKINGSFDGSLRKLVRLQLEADNYEVNSMVIEKENISVDAERIG